MSVSVNYTYLNSIRPKYFNPTQDYKLFFGSSVNRKLKPKNNEKETICGTKNGLEKTTKTFDEIIKDIIESKGFIGSLNPERKQEKTETDDKTNEANKGNDSVNTISNRTRNKIKNKLFSWFHASDNKGLTFVTLTFIQDVEDKVAVKVLNNWLTKLRKKEGKFSYLWVIERQHKNNGRLHFHLVTSKYWNIQQANEDWINYQLLDGLTNENLKKVSKFQKKSKTPLINQNVGKNEWWDLNPFQAEHIKQIEGLTKYLNKYVTKNEDSFKCAVWHCSRDISNLFTGYRGNTTDLHTLLSDINTFSYYNKKEGKMVSLGAFETATAIIYPLLNPHLYLERFSGVYEINKYILENQPKRNEIESKIPIYNFFYSEL